MQNTQFAYWLQGFFEIAKPETITAEQVTIIRNHIALVKKCWEPRKLVAASNDGPYDGELSMEDLTQSEMENLPALIEEDDTNLFVTNIGSGETLLRC